MMTKKKQRHTPFFLTQNPPKIQPNGNFLPSPTHYTTTQWTCQASNTPCALANWSVPALQETLSRFEPVSTPAVFVRLGEHTVASTRRHVLRKLQVENLLLGVWKKKKGVRPVEPRKKPGPTFH